MKSESLQQRNRGLRFPTLRTFFRFFLIIQIGLIHNPHFVSGWSCYNCTSEDKGCNNQLSPSSTAFIKECDAAAIGCLVYAYEYDYIDGVVFHRDCVYPGDMKIWANYKNGIWQEEFDSRGEFYHEEDKWYYHYWLVKWNNNRRDVRHPLVNQIDHHGGNGKLRILMYDESRKELSNSISLSEWKKTWPEPRSLSPTRQKSIQCYSCKTTEQGDLNSAENMEEEKSQGASSLLRECGELKIVTCKNAYGCATHYEKTDVQDVSGFNLKKFNKTVVWRGCWYPGEMKCLRRGYDYGRSLALNKSRQGMEDKASECGSAYKRSYEDGKGEVIWSGKKPFLGNLEFRLYQECSHKTRKFAGLDEPRPAYVPYYPEVTDGFAVIHYRFCGPKSKCNRDEKTPEEKEDKKGEEGNKGDEEEKGEIKECKEGPEGDDEFGPELETCNCTVVHEKDGAGFSKRDGDMKMIALVLLTGFACVFWTTGN